MTQASDEDVPESLWDLAESPPANTRGWLNPYDIKLAALAIADTEGLAALTMRSLADKLGVAPMAVYRHTKSKEAVISLIVNQVNGEMILSQVESKDWRTVMRDAAILCRAVILRHRWVAEVPASLLYAATPDGLAALEQMLAALDGTALSTEAKMDIATSVSSYARAMTLAEISEVQLRELGQAEIDITHLSRHRILSDYVYSKSPPDKPRRRFEFGLESLLDGISSRLAI